MQFLAAICLWLLFLFYSPQASPTPTPSNALQLQQQGNWKGAEALWRALITANPNDYRYWGSLGVCLAHENRFDDAIGAYQRALQLQPHDPPAELNLGIAYFKLGQLKKAIPPLETAAHSFPANPQIDLLLGMSFYGTGRYHDAIPYLKTVAAANLDNAELQLTLARSYLLSGAYEQAKDQFKSMLLHNEDSGAVHMLLGEAYDGLGKTMDALAEFRAAADRHAPDAHFALGYMLWRDKHYTEAAEEFRKELARDPAQYEALAYLGDCLLKAGDKQQAKRLFEKSIQQRDVLWITHYDLGLIAADQKNYRTAIAELQRAVSLNNKRPEVHYHLAQLYKATGNAAAAQRELRTVTQLHAQSTEDYIVKVHR